MADRRHERVWTDGLAGQRGFSRRVRSARFQEALRGGLAMLREEFAHERGDGRLVGVERSKPRVALLVRERERLIEVWIDLSPLVCAQHKRCSPNRKSKR